MITEKYVIVCDDVRREDNGKFILLGVYTPDMAVPSIPFIIPTLTFFLCLHSDAAGTFQFDVKITHLETGNQVSNAAAIGQMQFSAPGLAVAPVRFANIQFNAGGAYIFALTIQGQRDPITAQFNVVLNIPGVTPIQQQRPIR